VPADLVTWGSILNEARSNTFAWWLAVFPGAAIFLAVVAYYLVGEGLRDALDPRLQ
jgi:peptide/nickel transport system permease protein